MNYSKDNLWQIEQNGFDQAYLGKIESITALGYGYLGARSAVEEAYISETRDTFVTRIFNAFDENGVTEFPNVPDMWAITLVFNDEPLNLTRVSSVLARNY